MRIKLFVCLCEIINLASSQEIKRIVLLGERNSGTNFIEKILTHSLQTQFYE